MIQALYNKDSFKQQDEDFRIGVVISDGMWYSLPKWRKIAKVSEEKINEWVEEHMANGMLVQSATGAKSYRFPLSSIKKWYEQNNLDMNVQLIDFLFPPRIWDGKTETEGFLEAPRRELGTVAFSCPKDLAQHVTDALKGIGKVRETKPDCYKVYCLDSRFAKAKVKEVFDEHGHVDSSLRINVSIWRREIIDFSPEFSRGLVMFYKNFGKTLVKGFMNTISIYLPDSEDQESQIIMWVLAAIEKFDERSSVPFSGYLNSVLPRWTYDLPDAQLGKDLSAFQRGRARALAALSKEASDKTVITNRQLAEEMGYSQHEFDALEEKHKVWIATKNATTLTWTESSEEKGGTMGDQKLHRGAGADNDLELSNRISRAVVSAALKTDLYEDAFSIIAQIDVNDVNLSKLKEVSDDFIKALGVELGITV